MHALPRPAVKPSAQQYRDGDEQRRHDVEEDRAGLPPGAVRRRRRARALPGRRGGAGCSGRNGGAVVALVLLRVLLEDLRLGGVGRHAQDLGAVGEGGGVAAERGQVHGAGDVDLEPQRRLVAVLDQHAHAQLAGGHHLLQPRAAVGRRRARRRLVLHERQARRQPHQPVRAHGAVLGEVRAGHAGPRRRQHGRHHHQRRRRRRAAAREEGRHGVGRRPLC
uniref:Uncharacterized protein n=1 Tax=Zea mays TaxID=4577 RepID=C0PAI6_MAIZE|nr:unknown [Zea mays]